MERAKVALAGAGDYEDESLDRALESVLESLGGIRWFLPKSGTVLIKPNFLVPKKEESAVTTNPRFIAAVAKVIRRHYDGRIILGDGPALGTSNLIARKLKLHHMLEPLDVEVVDFQDTKPTHGGGGFGAMNLARPIVEAAAIVNLPKVKTHGQMYMTCGIKNCFGAFVGLDKPRLHLTAGRDYRTFARLLIETWQRVAPVLTIADGIVAMEGNGPGNGDPRFLGLVAASGNALALDRVVAHVLGFEPDKIPVLQEASAMGLHPESLDDIEILGREPGAFRVPDFKPVSEVVSVDTAGVPRFLAAIMRRVWTTRPEINHRECTRCGQCVRQCPAKAMRIASPGLGRNERVVIDLDVCIRCYCCQEVCPEGAITVGKGPLLKVAGWGEDILMKMAGRLGLG